MLVTVTLFTVTGVTTDIDQQQHRILERMWSNFHVQQTTR